MLKTLMLIGSGGFLGAVSRYLLTRFTTSLWPGTFPLGTFAVNILGCLFIGIVMGLSFRSALSTPYRLLLATGFCGGFTTFSTYALEIFELHDRGEAGLGLVYLLASIVLGLICVGLGLWLGRYLVRG